MEKYTLRKLIANLFFQVFLLDYIDELTILILNDMEGSVFIKNLSGNIYLMDEQGNININAPKNMTFTAEETWTLILPEYLTLRSLKKHEH